MTLNSDWVPVSGALSILCNIWAGRRDLSVYLGRDGGQGKASAFFDPRLKQIEINSKDAFGKDMDGALIGDLTNRTELAKYPVCGGLALHESGHARYSTADWEALRKQFDTDRAWNVYKNLEESRIEGRIAMLYPSDVGYLRACTRTLLMGDDPSAWSPRAAAQLLVGREVVNVLEAKDIAPVVTHLLANGWTEEILETLADITSEFLMLDDSGADLDRQIMLAKELDKAMPEDPKADGGDGEGDGGLGEAIGEALDSAERGGRMSVILEGEAIEARNEREAQAAQDRVQSENENAAGETFRNSGGNDAKVPSKLQGSRAPSSDERAAAVRLARALEKAKYRDRIQTEFNTDVPPGRFNGGEAMRMAAARSIGGDTSRFKPFRHQRFEETEEPPLTVGLMSDVSGSMDNVQPAIGVATYVVSEAIYRIDRATAASVYFGQGVYPGLRKKQRMMRVHTWSGTEGWEDFDGGFRALDGELNLLHGEGARLLIVCSDGQYGANPYNGRSRVDQAQARDRWVETCAKNGVGVVWLQLRGQHAPVEERPGVEVLTVGTDILGATEAIGQACIRALEHASKR